MSTSTIFDAVVIGLGGMGSAALAHLAGRGAQVIGVEAFTPAHTLGSSHGDTRIIRLGYHEGLAYVPLLRRAYENWRELERATGEKVLSVTGVLQIGRPEGTLVSRTIQSCRQYGLAHEVLDAASMRRRFPAFALEDDEVAVLEKQGGFIRPEVAVAAHLALARARGAQIKTGCRVEAIEPSASGVMIGLAGGEAVRARRAVVATGPWIAELVPQLRGLAQPIRQVVAWYPPAAPGDVDPSTMPVFLRDEGQAGSFFGFPNVDGRGVKVGKHVHMREPLDPDAPNAPVNERDVALLDDFVARRLPGAAGSMLASTTCRYTMLPGEDFLLDHMPGEPSIVVASPCSGHGYKFASVIGEILADLALDGGSSQPIEAFGFDALERKAPSAAVRAPA